MTGLDLSIVAIYLVAVTVIGVLMTRRAARSVDSYLLGGKTLPWYLLGLSNAPAPCPACRPGATVRH